MEANAKKKFICKFCNKRYPCGKSLGGHIRIHFSGGPNDVVVEEEANKFNISSSGSSKRDSGPDAALGAGQSGYVLRENPKKTRRFDLDASNNSCLLPEKVCRECGKGFQSLKALCGHMACHSRYSSEDHSGSSEKLEDMVMDSQSDTETSAPIKRRRSERTRYKSIGAPSSSFSMANGSLSSASDIEQEQEELAICLMMLSRDSGFRGCCSLVADSSDINSVVLEAKSSDTKMKIKVKDGVNCVYDNGDEYWEMKKGKDREVMYVESDDSENSDSGYFRYGPKKVESEISVHGFPRTNGEIKKHKVELQPRPDEEEKDLGAELGTKLSKLSRVKTCSGKNLIAENGGHQADRAPTKYDLKKRAKKNSTVAETYNTNAQNTGKSVTRGGNRTNHKRPIACVESVYESGENSIDTEYVPAQEPASSRAVQSGKGKRPVEQKPARNGEKKLGSKKSKAHECPFCFKVFRSGQALGGHKRSHFVGGAGDRTVVIKQEVAEMSMARLIDLNLPAPVDDEANGFIQW